MKTTAIVGISKNAGKTSYLNWYIKNQKQSTTFAVTTTGHDGEDIDLITGDKKPKVLLPANTLFTSSANIYDTQSSQIEVVEKLPFRVIGKPLWLYKTIGAIEAEVIGAATRKEQESLIEIFKKHDTQHILIDGSLDRKSICLSDKITEIALVIGASAGNLNEITKKAQILKLYSDIPLNRETMHTSQCITYFQKDKITQTDIASIYSNETKIIEILSQKPRWIYFPAAITDKSYSKLKYTLLNTTSDIVFHHPLNINLPATDINDLINTNKLFTNTRFPLKTIAVNSHATNNEHIDVELLKYEIKKIFIDLPVIDITEIY